MDKLLEAGAENCVVRCAGARRGTRLFVVSERGAVDEAVVAAIGAAAREAGAEVCEVWGERIPKARPDDVPAEVLSAYREADVIISHYPSLKREVLFEHFGNETRIRVPNRARTEILLSSEWGRFPYEVQRVIATRLDEMMAAGLSWHITSPRGTDLRGTFAGSGGEVGAAFFVDTEEGRARRNFPGGVHNPRNCTDVRGVLVVDYADGIAVHESDEPLRLKLKDGRVVAATGGDAAGKARTAVMATDRWIDSWHAGVHPRTEVPIRRGDNEKEWFSYSHCSPDVIHFHLGRTHATTNLACFGHTLEVGSDVLYQDGRLRIYDDPVVAREIARAHLAASMIENKAYLRW
jgi:hypothetical protein